MWRTPCRRPAPTSAHAPSPQFSLQVSPLPPSFILTYALDEVLHRMKEYAGTTFHFQPYILLSAILPPFVIAGFFALASFILRRLAPSRAVGGICLVAGLFIAAEYVSFLFGIPPWLRATPVGKFHVAVMTFGSELTSLLPSLNLDRHRHCRVEEGPFQFLPGPALNPWRRLTTRWSPSASFRGSSTDPASRAFGFGAILGLGLAGRLPHRGAPRNLKAVRRQYASQRAAPQ